MSARAIFNTKGSRREQRVAVKMLKPNHNREEWYDLLSEYSFLKEMNHPNVIKLLGACTTKGGPLCIIMEYAQYGSLRNYLRASRGICPMISQPRSCIAVGAQAKRQMCDESKEKFSVP